MTHTRPQADPLEGTVSITDAVVQDLQDRRQMGIAKYGTELKANNGRRPMVDLYQELIDATLYAKQVLIEAEKGVGDDPGIQSLLANQQEQISILSEMVSLGDSLRDTLKNDLRAALGLLDALVDDPLNLELQSKARELSARSVL